eukprot:gb/GFBE01062639.1/.p1 GENE.gb/GFBE01062639.1/~~gb/GFBE01062639.1/.p1  ORF type:complete len:820 (+),score=170.15 gb/GFBE01062639.1/:1-2460(+)
MGRGKSSWKTLNFAKQRLTDDDLPGLVLSKESTTYEEVDFSQNKLTSSSLRIIVNFCIRCPNLRVLKVYKNDVDDAGAKELARLLEKNPTLEEVHLSHNRITAKGVHAMLTAADRWRPDNLCPLWLRLEQNLVASPTAFIRSVENKLSVCRRDDERRCTTRHCCWSKKVHVPFLYMQKDSWQEDDNWQESAWQDDAAWPEESAWQDDAAWPEEPAVLKKGSWKSARKDGATAHGDRAEQDYNWPAEWTGASSSKDKYRGKSTAQEEEDDPKKESSAVALVEPPAKPKAVVSLPRWKVKGDEQDENKDAGNKDPEERENPITAWAKSVSRVWAPTGEPKDTEAAEASQPASSGANETLTVEGLAALRGVLDGASSRKKEGKDRSKRKQSKCEQILLNNAILQQDENSEYLARLRKAKAAGSQKTTADEIAQMATCLEALNVLIATGLEKGEKWRASAFGSMETGFGTKGCDLDVVIIEANAAERNSNPQNILMKLRQLLLVSDFAVKNIILSARVPILKLEYKGQDVDVSVNNVRPLVNTRLLKAYGSLHPLIIEFGIAVKIWAKEANLCGGADGHLSSYSFILMALYFLQVAIPGPIPCLQQGGASNAAFEDDSAAEERVREAQAENSFLQNSSLRILLAGFFAFYGGTMGPSMSAPPFAWGKEVVSVRLGRREMSDSEEFKALKGRHEDRLHIEDPFELGRNLRDVLRNHPTDNEAKLQEEICWMDHACRDDFGREMGIPGQEHLLMHPPPAGIPPFWEFPGAFDPKVLGNAMNQMYSQSSPDVPARPGPINKSHKGKSSTVTRHRPRPRAGSDGSNK